MRHGKADHPLIGLCVGLRVPLRRAWQLQPLEGLGQERGHADEGGAECHRLQMAQPFPPLLCPHSQTLFAVHLIDPIVIHLPPLAAEHDPQPAVSEASARCRELSQP